MKKIRRARWRRRLRAKPRVTNSAICQRPAVTTSAVWIIRTVRNSHLWFNCDSAQCGVVMWYNSNCECLCCVCVLRCLRRGRGGCRRSSTRWPGSRTTAGLATPPALRTVPDCCRGGRGIRRLRHLGKETNYN